MKIYYLTSSKFEGEIELQYDENGYLLRFDNRAILNQEQSFWFLNNLPLTFSGLEMLIKQASSVKLSEIKQDITFDMFWDKYNDKLNSSKKRTLQRWQRMSKNEQAKAYNYIVKYFATIPKGITKKYAATYLNDELWNN